MCRYLQKRRDKQGPNFTYEVIVVDDGSRDATVRKAFEYVRKHGIDAVRVLQLPRNYGKVRAALASLAASRCVLVVQAGAHSLLVPILTAYSMSFTAPKWVATPA